MDTRTREAVRYLGYGKSAVDEPTLQLISDSFKELDEIADVKFTYRIFELIQDEKETVKIEHFAIKSKSLSKNLTDCKNVIFLAITLGTQVDRMLHKYEVVNMPKAVVFQACAAAFLEEKCDDLVEKMAEEYKKENLYLRPRFSPGYGDFDISHQGDVLQLLETHKRIGLTMTESCMLVPTKSVTALIGIGSKNEKCHKEGCEMCSKIDCLYRRS